MGIALGVGMWLMPTIQISDFQEVKRMFVCVFCKFRINFYSKPLNKISSYVPDWTLLRKLEKSVGNSVSVGTTWRQSLVYRKGILNETVGGIKDWFWNITYLIAYSYK